MPAIQSRQSWMMFAILLVAALALRADTFGDPNMHGDEVFYHTVGIAMHHGALPYVDIWDRKPFGLFALFWLITAISEASIAYQIAAAGFAAGTAWAIAAIARSWTSATGAVLAGAAYLLILPVLQGFGGQSPVFYNLFIALAALLVFRALPDLRKGTVPGAVPLAMLIAGAGITLKTTALAEAAFVGLLALAALWRSPMAKPAVLRHAAGWAAIGAAPSLAIALGYWAIGHWAEFWHAMFASNFAKTLYWSDSVMRLRVMALALAPLVVFAALGLMRQKTERGFVMAWLAAAVIGLCLMPNFYLHYAMPLAVPLCLAASGLFGRGLIGFICVGLIAAFSLSAAPQRWGQAQRSEAAIARLTQSVRAHIGQGELLLYDAPPQLYRRTGQPLITPLVFPTHLSHGTERDTSHLSTLGETRRALARRPGAVVMAQPPRNGPINQETYQLVLAYVGANCQLVDVVPTPERQRTDMIAVWGNCRK